VDTILSKKVQNAELMEFLSALDDFKSALISLNEPDEVCQKIIEYTKTILRSSESNIFLWNENSGVFIPKTASDSNHSEGTNLQFPVYNPFVLWLSDNSRMVEEKDLDILLGHLPITLDKAKEFFAKTKAKIVVPLVINQGLLGILALGPKAIGNGKYDYDDIDRLSEIVEVSVLSLSNSIFYRQLISITENLEVKVKERTRELEETQSQLVMSEKMASLGVMVAGIAHEINTPAGVINAASDNLQSNMMYTYLHVNDLYQYLNVPDIRRSFRKLLVRLMREKPITRIDPTNKFKIKREIKESLLKSGLSEQDASDGSLLLVENSVPEMMEDLINLYKSKSYPLIDILKNGIAAARNIKNIKYSIKNIVRIVKALKYYSHLDQSSHGLADITEGIENTLIILNNQIKSGIEIERDYQPIPKINCNIDELNQVWTNLINNSIHAVRNQPSPKIKISTSEAKLAGNSYVKIIVEDNGVGIRPEIMDRIWDPFFTTKDQGEGSGLGLGIVKGIVEKHKGSIQCISKNSITQFIVLLPMDLGSEPDPPIQENRI
jgi:signal transduction histidine kinase